MGRTLEKILCRAGDKDCWLVLGMGSTATSALLGYSHSKGHLLNHTELIGGTAAAGPAWSLLSGITYDRDYYKNQRSEGRIPKGIKHIPGHCWKRPAIIAAANTLAFGIGYAIGMIDQGYF